jgi:hypothetical protein
VLIRTSARIPVAESGRHVWLRVSPGAERGASRWDQSRAALRAAPASRHGVTAYFPRPRKAGITASRDYNGVCQRATTWLCFVLVLSEAVLVIVIDVCTLAQPHRGCLRHSMPGEFSPDSGLLTRRA